jgi:hypothetical protein
MGPPSVPVSVTNKTGVVDFSGDSELAWTAPMAALGTFDTATERIAFLYHVYRARVILRSARTEPNQGACDYAKVCKPMSIECPN